MPILDSRSKSERVELGCCGCDLPFRTVQLSLFDHVHRLNATKDDARAPKGFES